MTENKTPQIIITLMVDWGTGPFWVSIDGGVDDTYLVEEITDVVPLSDDLLAAVEAWDERYQGTYNKADPRESGIHDATERASFIAEGHELAKRLRAELPRDVEVRYVELGGLETTLE
jgi:hypothetical protein